MIVNRLPLSFVSVLPLLLVACGGDGLTLPPEGEAAHIEVMDGNDQSGTVGSTLGRPLLVLVTDTRDRPVSGATVVFSFPSAAQGEASPATTTTDSEGHASSTLRLGSTPGEITGKVEVPVDEGITPVEASFTATALSEDADRIASLSGDEQSAPVNTALPAPLVVEVTDQFGNPISGVTIAWSFTGGGSVSAASTVTDASGQASVTRTLGPTAGEQTTIATADGLAGSPVTFTHVATAGSAAGVNKVGGDNQSALVGTELALPLVVQVLDDQGNPIPNRAVTWVTGDGSVNPENTTTDAQGNASTRWTLGPTPGAKTANAVVSGVGTATFNATATAGSPSAATSTVSASPATITAGSGTSTITVTVRDDANNPVSGVSVSVASSGSENTITPPTASTGGNGVATFTFSSTVAETKTITATAGGVAITDGATVTVQKASSTIEITSDEPEPSVAGLEAVTVEFTVRGTGGGVPTGNVTVTISNGAPTETCSGQLTDGSGSCSFTPLTPGAPPNNRRVLTATYDGDARFSGDTDTDNHRVDPGPVSNNPPAADFAPPSCTAGQPCQFNDGSTDGDGTVVTWNWNFGPGGASTDEHPTPTFPAAGTFPVTLTVTDDDGATDEVTKDVTVSEPANTAPTASFVAPACVAGADCLFSGSGTDGDGTVDTYSWDFGDPTSGAPTAEGQEVTHNFATAGPYTVTLTVTDDDGADSAPYPQTVMVE